MFSNRKQAGILLGARLGRFKNVAGLVLVVPRGGVPVGYEVAKALNMKMEVVLVKKLGHPLNKEYAIGAVGLREMFVIPHEEVSDDYIQSQTAKIRARLKEMQNKFLSGREPSDLKDKTVIIIDDGVATGNTLLATIHILRKEDPAAIIVAAPVISREAARKLRLVCDEVIALLIPENFYGVGAFYEDFTQVSDDEVIGYIEKMNSQKEHGIGDSLIL